MLNAFLLSAVLYSLNTTFADDTVAKADVAPRDPMSITMLKMDLDAAQAALNRHDLNDDGSLNERELERLSWGSDELKRFDLNRSGDLQHVEIALKFADRRVDDGIVQMDATLAEKYTRQYDANHDGKLSLDELSKNVFTDQLDAFDQDSDGELSSRELIAGLAFERRFRDELGIKGCDQGGAMKLIGRGDQNADKCIDRDELKQISLSEKAMKFDRNVNGKLSVSELAEMLASRRNQLGLTPSDQLSVREMLTRLDRDRDGEIVVADLPPQPPGSTLLEFDADGDGKITEIEMERHMGKRRKELGYDDDHAKRAGILIQRNDSDRSRTLSKSELTASGSDRNSPLSPDKMLAIDADKDGQLSLEELARYLAKTANR
ncbi:MAG: hypothetical protein WBD20_12955 [Pirellulaceae bacterium]